MVQYLDLCFFLVSTIVYLYDVADLVFRREGSRGINLKLTKQFGAFVLAAEANTINWQRLNGGKTICNRVVEVVRVI